MKIKNKSDIKNKNEKSEIKCKKKIFHRQTSTKS